MTDATNNTPAQLERMLDQAVVGLARFQVEHPHEDLDEPCDAIDEVVELIEQHVPLRTLGDMRLRAKALHHFYTGEYIDDKVGPLHEALAALPERLWDEPIGRQVEARS